MKFIYFCLVLVFSISAQTNLQLELKTLSSLKDPDFFKRSLAIDDISTNENLIRSEKIQTALIELLNKELGDSNSFRATVSDERSEGQAEYFHRLVLLVAKFSHRDDAFEIIKKIGFIPELANFGEKGINVIINKAINNNILALKYLESLLKEKKITDRQTINFVRDNLIQNLENSALVHPDSSKFTTSVSFRSIALQRAMQRIAILRLLAKCGKTDSIISILKKYSESDPFAMGGRNKQKYYPVRDEANSLLYDIQK